MRKAKEIVSNKIKCSDALWAVLCPELVHKKNDGDEDNYCDYDDDGHI